MGLLQHNIKMGCCLVLSLVLVFADLGIRIDIDVEVHVKIHVNVHVLYANVVCCTAHLVEEGVLALRCGKEVVLSLEQTLVHK